MCFPILIINNLSLFIEFLLHFLLVIFSEGTCNNIEISLLLAQQGFCSFNWYSCLSLFKEVLRQFLIIDDIVSIANGT